MSESGSPEAPQPQSAAPMLRQHSNDNLLKIDTSDHYSTVANIKKFIIKSLGDKIDGSVQPLFHGMQRMNKNPKNPHLFIAFENERDKEAALSLLTQVSYRGNAWKSVPVTPRDLNLTHKGGGAKRPRDGDGDTSKLTQYEKYPIEQQLELKKAHCLKVMKLIVPTRPHGWSAYSDRFLGIVESPELTGYRNHVNLSFGLTADGTPSLGFMTGSLLEGASSIESAVDESKEILTMNVAAKVVAMAVMKVFAEFAGEPTKLEVFDKVSGKGFWRRLQIRHNVQGEVMGDLELDKDSIPADVFAKVEERLKDVLTGPEMERRLQQATGKATSKVVSLQYHKHTGTNSLPTNAERVVLAGASTLTETLANLQFELSPTAFFQVNTSGMQKMLEKVHEVAELSPTTTLLDLCSGTGTIGLTLARYVKRVIGIELIDSAVENAKRNAERNAITNAVFHCGRVEDLLPSVINSLTQEDRQDIVAILDPPRAGVNATVLKWIRGTETIRRAVYISCEQKALERDCPALTKPTTKAYRGAPFEVSAGFAVDLFPHTHHVEMVAVLTRTKAEGVATQDGANSAEDSNENQKDGGDNNADGGDDTENCDPEN